MSDALKSLLDAVSGKLIRIRFRADDDIDRMMDSRDEPRFEREWLRVSDLVEKAQVKTPSSKAQMRMLDKVREVAFKKA